MLNWDSHGSRVYCNGIHQFTCIAPNSHTKAEHYARILGALEAMHTLTRDATGNRKELVP